MNQVETTVAGRRNLLAAFGGRKPPAMRRAAAVGEPWLTYFDVPTLDAKLRSFGFSNVSFLTADDIRRRYIADTADSLPVPERISIASAIV